MNSPHSSSQSAIEETAAGSKTPPILRLVCGPQTEGFSMKGEVGFRREDVGALFRPSLLGDCGHLSVVLQAVGEGSPVG